MTKDQVEAAKQYSLERTSVNIGELLLEKKVISQDQLDIAIKERKDTGSKESVGNILVKMGFITEATLGELLSESSGVKKLDLKSAIIDQRLVKKIPKGFALQNKVIPISYTKNTITIAIADVFDIITIDQIKRFFPSNFEIKPVYALEGEIIHAIDQYYEYEMSIDGILKEIESGEITGEEDSQKALKEDYRSPMVRLVDALLTDAVRVGASDLHFEPESFFLRLRYRIDGQMEQTRSFHKDYWSAIAVRIKIMSGMNIAETRKPQDGRIRATILGRNVDFRVSTQPTVDGENIVIRILDEKSAIISMNSLGFTEYHMRLIQKCLKRPEGVLILSGPTGSGKTTTLYTLIHYVNSITKNVMTLEDPVEYRLPLIRQSNVKPDIGWGFAEGIRTVLRQDPDVILVGEVRDGETANTAMQAAMTGHQVFTSLHTNNSFAAIPRLLYMGVQPYLLSGSLICIVAQRLARRLCPHCKEAYEPTRVDKKILADYGQNPKTLYKPVGCPKCRNSGYKGRLAIAEILDIDKELDNLISVGASKKEMMAYVVKRGFITMQKDGVDKVVSGITSMEELIRAVDMTESMEVKIEKHVAKQIIQQEQPLKTEEAPRRVKYPPPKQTMEQEQSPVKQEETTKKEEKMEAQKTQEKQQPK
jgi:type II secretory ATPase GspE/PulE/Tfp pilus assembly ATPase PilB-like protein